MKKARMTKSSVSGLHFSTSFLSSFFLIELSKEENLSNFDFAVNRELTETFHRKEIFVSFSLQAKLFVSVLSRL